MQEDLSNFESASSAPFPSMVYGLFRMTSVRRFLRPRSSSLFFFPLFFFDLIAFGSTRPPLAFILFFRDQSKGAYIERSFSSELSLLKSQRPGLPFPKVLPRGARSPPRLPASTASTRSYSSQDSGRLQLCNKRFRSVFPLCAAAF